MQPSLNNLEVLKKFLESLYRQEQHALKQYPGRQIVLHIGPTNSGKTYEALQEALKAKTALYCAPLRLLAQQVFEKGSAVRPSRLITGELIKGEQDATFISCTAEMFSAKDAFDVAILDEGQLMTDAERGWAFTRVMQHAQAKKLFVCGEPGIVELTKRLARPGDSIEVKTFERLAPLQLEKKHLRSIHSVQPGDALVAFSRRGIYDLRARVETLTGQRCSLVYGRLPVESRIAQAEAFNQEPGQVLVASDAIGMGLNLQIKRILFTEMMKHHGMRTELVAEPLVKQISGRAGRFGGRYTSGLVNAFGKEEHSYIRSCLSSPPAIYSNAGIIPTDEQLVALMSEFPGVTLFDLLRQIDQGLAMHVFASLSLFQCRLRVPLNVLSLLQDLSLPLKLQLQLMRAPLDADDVRMSHLFRDHYVNRLLKEEPCNLPNFSILPGLPLKIKLEASESIYKSLDLHCWLAHRFPGQVVDLEEALEKRQYWSTLISEILNEMSKVRTKRK